MLTPVTHACAGQAISGMVRASLPGPPGARTRLGGEQAAGDNRRMVDDIARERAIYQALKAADEVAAALQAHLIEEHQADPERAAAQSTSTNSLKLLRQARERLGQGLRAVEAGGIGESDGISLRNP
jgi:hypothetical protein